MSTIYEYKTIVKSSVHYTGSGYFPHQSLEYLLNKMSSEGWRFVAEVKLGQSYLIFERPIQLK